MPNTSSGAPYTLTTATLPTHGNVTLGVGDEFSGDSNLPTLLYTHGSQADSMQFSTLPRWEAWKDWVVTHGYAWVEADGGPPVTSTPNGPSNWGNAAARAAYPAALEWAGTHIDIGHKGPFGRSMGGLVALFLASSKCDIDFDFAIMSSGVSTMLVGTEENAPTGSSDAVKAAYKLTQCTAFYFGALLRGAYGKASYASLKSYLQDDGADFCPETWDPDVFDGVNILNCYGNADVTVPWNNRGGDPMRTLWNGHPATDAVSMTEGGTHDSGGPTDNGSYGDVANMATFLAPWTTIETEPVVKTYELVVDTPYMMIDGKRHGIFPTPMQVPAS